MLDVAQFSIEFLFILKRPLLSSSATSRFSAILEKTFTYNIFRITKVIHSIFSLCVLSSNTESEEDIPLRVFV